MTKIYKTAFVMNKIFCTFASIIMSFMSILDKTSLPHGISMKKSAKIKFLIAGLLLMFLNDGTTYFGIKTTYIGIVFLFISTLLFMKVIKTKDDSDENKDEFSTKILKISILMIGVVAFIGYRIFYVNNNQDLYLVNGFSDECKVDFADGTTVIIKANDHASIQLPEGTS